MNIHDYKGMLIKDISHEHFHYFLDKDGMVIEGTLLALIATRKVPENINDQWTLFECPPKDDEDTALYGCGILLPILKEMEHIVNTILCGAFHYYTTLVVGKNGKTLPVDGSESYERFLNAHGLSWDKNTHYFRTCAFPIDATAHNIKLLTGLDINHDDIDKNNECGLGLFVMDI